MSQHCSSCWPAQRFPIKKYKTFSVFPYSYRNTSGSLGEREIEVGTRARSASVSTQFRVLPNFHECFYNVWEHGKNVFYFSYKITRRKITRLQHCSSQIKSRYHAARFSDVKREPDYFAYSQYFTNFRVFHPQSNSTQVRSLDVQSTLFQEANSVFVSSILPPFLCRDVSMTRA